MGSEMCIRDRQDGQREADGVGLPLDDGFHRVADAVRHPDEFVKGAAAAFPRVNYHLSLSLGCPTLSDGLFGIPAFRGARPTVLTDSTSCRGSRAMPRCGSRRAAVCRPAAMVPSEAERGASGAVRGAIGIDGGELWSTVEGNGAYGRHDGALCGLGERR